MSGNPESKAAAEALPRAGRPNEADLRVRRTRDTLGDALVELMQEKSFDGITVQEVLDRAGVGRTTFYTHYRDKQDLFLSDVEEFLEAMSTLLTRRGAPLRRVAPVEELFAHVADVRRFHDALVVSGKAADVRELGIGYFARSIAQRLTMAGVRLPQNELRAMSHALAGGLFSLLEWWVLHAGGGSPGAMDALFHRMVWDGVAAECSPGVPD